MTDTPEILFDPEIDGVLVEGLSVGQVKKLKELYQIWTQGIDMDFERLDEFHEHFTKFPGDTGKFELKTPPREE